MVLTKEQLSEFMCKHAEKENGLHDLIEIMLESMMVAERGEYLRGMDDGNKGILPGITTDTHNSSASASRLFYGRIADG